MKIQYVIGDVLEPIGSANEKLIVHCVNNEYSFSSGVAGAIAKKWPHVRQEYLNKPGWSLGDIQYVKADDSLYVVNLCGQRGVGEWLGTKPVRYESIRDGLLILREDLEDMEGLNDDFKTSLHFPRLGAGLAGGSWAKVEEVINEVFENTKYEVYVYDLPGPTNFNP